MPCVTQQVNRKAQPVLIL